MKAIITALALLLTGTLAAHAQQELKGKDALEFIQKADKILVTRRVAGEYYTGYETLLIHKSELWRCTFLAGSESIEVECDHWL